MEPERINELLPWLLNGTLANDERSAVLAHLRDHAPSRRELGELLEAYKVFGGHPPAQALAAWVFELPLRAGEAETIAQHVALCDGCAEQAALVRQSRAFETADVVPLERRPAATGRRWRVVAMAAGLAAAVAFTGWLLSWRAGGLGVAGPPSAVETVVANVAVIDLVSESFTTRGPGDDLAAAVSRSAAAEGAVFVLDPYRGTLPEGVAGFTVEVRAAGGETVLSLDGLRHDPRIGFTVMVPAGALQVGAFIFELYHQGDDGRQLIDRFPLRVDP